MNRKMWLFTFAVVVIVLAVCGCSEDKSNGVVPGQWEIGATTVYDVLDNDEILVEDTNTGHYFYFPDGGAGTLEVGNIISGPEAPFDGQMIYVDYDGTESLQIIIPDTESKYDMVLGYGAATGCFDDSMDVDSRWISVALTDSIEGYLLFDLPMPFEELSKNIQGIRCSGWKGFKHYLIASIPAGSSDETKLTVIESQARNFINTYLNYLPAALQPAARAEVAGRLSPTFYADGNYYIGFTRRLLWNTTSSMIGLKPSVNDGTIAHEVGHYMNHVLVGDAVYLQIEDLAPDNPHGLADLHDGRTTITEDFAYFAEYFFNGVAQNWDPTDPYNIFRYVTTVNVDFPSLEGFGCALLASLHNTSSTIRDQETGLTVDIPVVGASFGDIFGLISLGATNINQLRDDVETYLTGEGQADKLPVILHRLGWRYMGHAKIVNQDGDPMPNVEVKFVAKVAGSPDYVEAGYNADSDGIVTFTRCFGGDSFIRVFHDGNSTDVPINIDWGHATNVPVELGEITVTAIDLSVINYAKIKVIAVGTWHSHQDSPVEDETYSHSGVVIHTQAFSGSFSGNTFCADPDNNPEATITIDLIAWKVISFEYTLTTSIVSYAVSGTNIPAPHVGGSFTLIGTEVCNHISNLENKSYSGENSWVELIDYSCDENSRIEISFYQ